MSRFLAPIHTWLFNKIKLYEELEFDLVRAYEDKFGDDIKTVYDEIKNRYGSPIENRPIEELIDVSNIHGWLQNKISLAETRQAALLTAIIPKHDDGAKTIAMDLYSKQGSKCGENAKEQYEVNNAPEIYQALNNYILEGMPCDRVNVVTENSEDKLEWRNEMCLHRGYWESVSGDVNIFYNLRDAWIKSFVENSNSSYTYNSNRDTATFEIVKK